MENLLVSIASFTKQNIGVFVKEKLEIEGIECYLLDKGFETETDFNPKGFKIKVRLGDTERAVKVLLQIHKEYDLDKVVIDNLPKDMKKILVPIDVSDYSINICEYAFGLAQKTDAEVKILYIYDDPMLSGSVKHTTSWKAHDKIVSAEAYNKAQTALLGFGQKLKEQINKELLRAIKIHFAILPGKPENKIAALSKNYKPDLIIMGSKRKIAMKSTFIGSVTTKVIENINYPVLTIPKSARFKGLDLINIMYATDFNETDNTSLNKLLEIVSPYKTKIHCIHIDIENDPLKQGKVDELNLFLKKEYGKYNIQCKLFENSNVIKGYETFIEENNIDLISFSSPRRTLFYKIFHPNKLKQLVLTSKIPMLVFPVE